MQKFNFQISRSNRMTIDPGIDSIYSYKSQILDDGIECSTLPNPIHLSATLERHLNTQYLGNLDEVLNPKSRLLFISE